MIINKHNIATGLIALSFLFLKSAYAQESSALIIARIQYSGGGDWYNDPSAIPNLAEFMRRTTRVDIAVREVRIRLTDETLYAYPILYLTGHGHIRFTEEEVTILRQYLLKGGFLYADDDYGMDASFRAAMKKVFPDRHWVELPFEHGLYQIHFKFPAGLPKIHEHDNKQPRGFAILDDEERVMVYYTFETNISDGWADEKVHHDPPGKRNEALRMGTNIIVWALMH